MGKEERVRERGRKEERVRERGRKEERVRERERRRERKSYKKRAMKTYPINNHKWKRQTNALC